MVKQTIKTKSVKKTSDKKKLFGTVNIRLKSNKDFANASKKTNNIIDWITITLIT